VYTHLLYPQGKIEKGEVREIDSERGEINSRSPWHGTLDLVYGRVGERTQVLQSRAQAPLKIQRPFYPEGPTICHSAMLHTAGGVVGGDRLSISIDLQPQAQVLLTTTAAAKLYRSNGLTAQQTVQMTVGAGACLEWLPLDTIVFEQAAYRQSVRVNLAVGAQWVGWEITRFGRSARGEAFRTGNWRSHTEVWQGERPLWCDRQWLPGSAAVYDGDHGLAGCPVVGSFVWITAPAAWVPTAGSTVPPEWVARARSQMQLTNGEGGVTRLQTGLLCRYRGHSSTEARRWFVEVWDGLRREIQGRSACISRLWGV
jgi:urease accessory protein